MSRRELEYTYECCGTRYQYVGMPKNICKSCDTQACSACWNAERQQCAKCWRKDDPHISHRATRIQLELEQARLNTLRPQLAAAIHIPQPERDRFIIECRASITDSHTRCQRLRQELATTVTHD
jgi:hypothetical protein